MAWIRLDDQIAHHPKFVKVGPVAAWLWVCGHSYCARYLTDGYIPQAALMTLGVSKPDAAVEKLVWAGLWEAADDGWRIHDYHDYQPTRETVEHTRQVRREAGRIGGKTAGKGRPKPNDRQNAKHDVSQNLGSGGYVTEQAKPQAKLSPVPVPVVRTKKEEDPAAAAAVPLPARSAGDLAVVTSSYNQPTIAAMIHRLTPDTAPALPRRRNGNGSS
jgi:hypothetical protein